MNGSKYFVLGMNTYMVPGKDSYCLYNLSSGEIMEINTDNGKMLQELESGTIVKKYGDNQIEFLNILSEKQFGSFEDSLIFSEKIRIGQAANLESPLDSYLHLQHLFLYLTSDCNMDCNFCTEDHIINRTTGCTRFKGNRDDYILSMSDYKIILNSALKLGCHSLNIIGGEPLLEKELLLSIIRYAKLIGYKTIYIYTNLMLLDDEIINELEGVIPIIHGLGHNQSIINAVDSTGTNFVKYRHNIEKLVQNNIPFYFNICITKENQEFVNEINNYLQQYNPIGIEHSYIFYDGFDCSTLYPKRVSPLNFLNNLKHHACINGKITIYENGDIGTCPLMRKNIIGNTNEDQLYKILGDKKQNLYWDLIPSRTTTCSECSSRYYCVDCRAIESTHTNSTFGKKFCPKNYI